MASILLGNLPFVGRTTGPLGGTDFDQFKSPFMLDSEARLHIGPADDIARNEHGAILVIYELLIQTKSTPFKFGGILRNRAHFLDTCQAFDDARTNRTDEGPRLVVYGTYDGNPIEPGKHDDLPAGPCGKSVNQIKYQLFKRCMKLDPEFPTRKLTEAQREQEATFIAEATSST